MLESDSGVWQEGPALQTVDTEVWWGRQWRVAKSLAGLRPPLVQISVKPEAKLTSTRPNHKVLAWSLIKIHFEKRRIHPVSLLTLMNNWFAVVQLKTLSSPESESTRNSQLSPVPKIDATVKIEIQDLFHLVLYNFRYWFYRILNSRFFRTEFDLPQKESVTLGGSDKRPPKITWSTSWQELKQ